MRSRGFEVISSSADKGINLPKRQTPSAAGYDIESAEDTILLPGEVTKVKTGLKAYMNDDEYLSIHLRSGFSIRNRLSLINDEGVIDADYYNNPGNEGHIIVAVINLGSEAVRVIKGERIAQGVFRKYLTTDDDNIVSSKREGGLGSTG